MVRRMRQKFGSLSHGAPNRARQTAACLLVDKRPNSTKDEHETRGCSNWLGLAIALVAALAAVSNSALVGFLSN